MSSHDWEMLIRLLLAAFLGGIVGIERGSGDRPAGFRTHILVCTNAIRHLFREKCYLY